MSLAQVHIAIRLSLPLLPTPYIMQEAPTLTDTRSTSIRSSPNLTDVHTISIHSSPVDALLKSTSLLNANLALLNHSSFLDADPFSSRPVPRTPTPKSGHRGKDHVQGLASAIKFAPGADLRDDNLSEEHGICLKAMKTLATFQWNPDALEGVLVPSA